MQFYCFVAPLVNGSKSFEQEKKYCDRKTYAECVHNVSFAQHIKTLIIPNNNNINTAQICVRLRRQRALINTSETGIQNVQRRQETLHGIVLKTEQRRTNKSIKGTVAASAVAAIEEKSACKSTNAEHVICGGE